MLSHFSKITQFRILLSAASADFRQYFVDISSTKEVWKNLLSAFQRARRELHIDTSYYFQGGRVGESKFSLLTTMPILDSIFLISIQKIAYILENGGWGGRGIAQP